MTFLWFHHNMLKNEPATRSFFQEFSWNDLILKSIKLWKSKLFHTFTNSSTREDSLSIASQIILCAINRWKLSKKENKENEITALHGWFYIFKKGRTEEWFKRCVTLWRRVHHHIMCQTWSESNNFMFASKITWLQVFH